MFFRFLSQVAFFHFTQKTKTPNWSEVAKQLKEKKV